MASESPFPKAVIFDLDDTLYDHLHSARHGLIELAKRYPLMQSVSVLELEDRYSDALESIHLRLLKGEVNQSTARIVRMQQLFASFGIDVGDQTAFDEYKRFRADYDSAGQVVAGTHDLLCQLRAINIRLAIITNNMVSEQWPKLEQLDLTRHFEVVSISEEVGASKPDRKIFDVTLDRLSLNVDEVVMVGDSLTSDIAGAIYIGMQCVWLDRRPERMTTPPADIGTIARDFSDVESSIKTILSPPACR